MSKLPTKLALLLIRVYQRLISADHGGILHIWYPSGVCRFHPSCSQFTLEAITTFGLIRGTILGMWRVLRCNPWSKGGLDLVKKN